MAGCDVSIIDRLPNEAFATGMARITRRNLLFLLNEYGVTQFGSHIIRSITKGSVTAETGDWQLKTIEADYVVDALGMRSDAAQVAGFRRLIPETYAVGDCNEVKNIKNANLTAYDCCCNI
jgi:hypothetical protein